MSSMDRSIGREVQYFAGLDEFGEERWIAGRIHQTALDGGERWFKVGRSGAGRPEEPSRWVRLTEIRGIPADHQVAPDGT